jgi:F420-dependent oxidoreductase-like protein
MQEDGRAKTGDTMKIGIGIGGSTVDEMVAQTERAASDGFMSGWLSNIFGVDAITAIAIAGRHVPGIHLGTAVVPTFPRHPHALAQQAQTAWDATDGRFTLGIGLSHQIVIETMLGLSYDKPALHMREYLSVLLPLLRKGNVAFEGERYRVNAPLDRMGPEGGPPVLLAAMAPVMLHLAGAVADGTILWMTGARTVGEHVVPRVTKAAADAGKAAPQIVASLPVAVTDDVDGAREKAAATFAVYGGLPSYRAMLDKEGAGGPQDVAIIGDEAAVEAGIRTMADAGVTEFSAALFGGGETIRRTSQFLRGLL